MGLMERDYMHEKRRKRPFSPPPARSGTSTLAMVLIFVAVLFGLYKIADWKLNHRAGDLASQQTAETAAKTATKPAAPATQAFIPAPNSMPDATAGTQRVTKCVTNGKTSYGDGPCAQGAVVSQVRTRTDHNLMAAVRPETVSVTPTEARISPRIVVAQNNPAADAAAAKKAECQFLNAEIKRLDALSRQPQGPQMQDWIRNERKMTRDKQFRLSCS